MIESIGIDVLIPIGGDDTLSYALRMHDEGVPVIAIPKTMDNDVHGTDYCIGFSTAITRGVQFIHNLRTSTGSHERIAVIELFGRYSGETSLITAYLAGVDRAVISEIPFDIDRLGALLSPTSRRIPSNYAMVTVSEGATLAGGEMVLSGEEDAYGHRKLGGIGELTSALIKERTGEDIIYQQLGYLMRSGQPGLARPDGGDELRRDGRRPGARGRDRPDGGAPQRHLHGRPDQRHARGRAARRRRRALRRRRSTGRRCGTWPASRCSCIESASMVIGVLTAGGDCPGLNAVIRGVVGRAVVTHGMEVVGIRNGWDGLMDGHVRPLGRDDVRGILAAGRHDPRHVAPRPVRPRRRLREHPPHVEANGIDARRRDRRRRHARHRARALHEEGLAVVGVPKTIDNDIAGHRL